MSINSTGLILGVALHAVTILVQVSLFGRTRFCWCCWMRRHRRIINSRPFDGWRHLLTIRSRPDIILNLKTHNTHSPRSHGQSSTSNITLITPQLNIGKQGPNYNYIVWSRLYLDIQAYTVLHKQISANPARPYGRHSPKSCPPSSPGATAQIINNQMDLTPHKQYHMATEQISFQSTLFERKPCVLSKKVQLTTN